MLKKQIKRLHEEKADRLWILDELSFKVDRSCLDDFVTHEEIDDCLDDFSRLLEELQDLQVGLSSATAENRYNTTITARVETATMHEDCDQDLHRAHRIHDHHKHNDHNDLNGHEREHDLFFCPRP